MKLTTKQKMVEVCCQCYYPGVESGQLDYDVWCPNCEKSISRSLIISEEEALNRRNELEAGID